MLYRDNDCGPLGLENCKRIKTFKILMNDISIKNIICGDFISVIHKNNGEVFIFESFSEAIINRIKTPKLLIKDDHIIQISCEWNNMMIYQDNDDDRYMLGKYK